MKTNIAPLRLGCLALALAGCVPDYQASVAPGALRYEDAIGGTGTDLVADVFQPADVVLITDVGPAADVFLPQDLPVISPDAVDAAEVAVDAAEDADPPPRYTYIACIADTHIVNSDGAPARNLRALGQSLAELRYPLAGVFVAGDVVFELPYDTFEEYEADPADRFDIAQEIFETFPAPVWPAMGNHDLDIGNLPREMTHQLFRKHFGVDPYYVVDLGTWKFIVLSNFLGTTQDPESPDYDLQTGSLGTTQSAWLEEQLSDGRPAILMVHFPMFVMAELPEIVARHQDTVRLVVAGHSHAWLNLSDNYYVPHLVTATSQYDGDSFMVVQLDNLLQTWRILNWSDFHWGTAYSSPGSEDAPE